MRRQVQKTGDDATRLLRRFPMSTGKQTREKKIGDISKRVRSTILERADEDDEEEDLEVASIPSMTGYDVDERDSSSRDATPLVVAAAAASKRSSPPREEKGRKKRPVRDDEEADEEQESRRSTSRTTSRSSRGKGKVDDSASRHRRIPEFKASEKGKISKAMRALSKLLQQIEEDIETAIDLLSIMIPAREADLEAQELARAFNDQDQQILKEKVQELRHQRDIIRKEISQKQALMDRNIHILKDKLHKRAVVLRAFNKDTKFFKRHPDVSHFFVEKQESMKAILAQVEESILNSSLDVVAAHVLGQQETMRKVLAETHDEEEEESEQE